jgi:hypothetical protein
MLYMFEKKCYFILKDPITYNNAKLFQYLMIPAYLCCLKTNFMNNIAKWIFGFVLDGSKNTLILGSHESHIFHIKFSPCFTI